MTSTNEVDEMAEKAGPSLKEIHNQIRAKRKADEAKKLKAKKARERAADLPAKEELSNKRAEANRKRERKPLTPAQIAARENLPKLNKEKRKIAKDLGMKFPSNRASETDIAKLERVARAFALRKGGASYQQIAANLNISESVARNYVNAELARLKEHVQEAAIEHRQLQLERLNEIILSYWPRRADPKYGSMLLALFNKQDALLGIQADKIELSVSQVSEIEKMAEGDIDRLLKQRLAGIVTPTPVNPHLVN